MASISCISGLLYKNDNRRLFEMTNGLFQMATTIGNDFLRKGKLQQRAIHAAAVES